MFFGIILWYAIGFTGVWYINTMLDGEKVWNEFPSFIQLILVSFIPIFLVVVGIFTVFEKGTKSN